MKWKNLKRGMCPNCNKSLFNGMTITEGGTIEEMEQGIMSGKMIHHDCGFMISEHRFNSIVHGIIQSDLAKKNRR